MTSVISLPKNGIVCSPTLLSKITELFLKDTLKYSSDHQIYVGDFEGQRFFVASSETGAKAATTLLKELVTLGAIRIIRVDSGDSPFLNLVEQTTSVKIDAYLKFAITLKACKLGITLLETSNEDQETGVLYSLGQQYDLKYASILMSYPNENLAITLALMSLAA